MPEFLSKTLSFFPWETYWEKFLSFTELFIPKLIGALIVLVVGWIIIQKIQNAVHKFFKKVNFDPALETFLESFLSITLKVLLLVMVATMVGVQTTSIIALLGAAGLAIGLALQGSLSNFAGGILILLFKPFRVGDTIEAQGQRGKVTEIQIFNTILRTADNKKVILPNGNLANDVMVNFTALPKRRVDFVFGIGYNDDIKKAKKILEELVLKDPRVLKEEKNMVVVGALNESSVDLWCRAWVKTEDYWDFFFEKNEAVKEAFDEAGITIPYPQRDIHLFYENRPPEKE